MGNLKEIQFIIFDAVGTLINPYPSVGEIYAEILARHGVAAPPGKLDRRFREAFKKAHSNRRLNITEASEKECWRRIVKNTFEGFRRGKDFDLVFEELYAAFASSRCWKTDPDTFQTLSELRENGYQAALLSNGDGRLRNVFRELGLAAFFKAIFLSAEIGYEKPDRRIFQFAEKALGARPNQFLLIGDSRKRDAAGALAAGWNYFLLEKRSDPSPHGAIKRLSDLPALLGKCGGGGLPH